MASSTSASEFSRAIRNHISADCVFRSAISLPLVTSDRPILILDMDETLVHHPRENTGPTLHYSGPSFTVAIPRVNSAGHATTSTLIVHERPFVRQFLAHVSTKYTVVVFTASEEVFASRVLAHLDSRGQWISAALYRDACTRPGPVMGRRNMGTTLLKDLTAVCEDERRVVLVDNSRSCFWFQEGNGLEIKPFENNSEDRELERLGGFLAKYAGEPDLTGLGMLWEPASGSASRR